MSFWLFIAALTGFSIFGLLWPLSVERRTGKIFDDRSFYQNQMAIIDHDLARGLIDAEAAEQAKQEAARRLLSVSHEDSGSSSPDQSVARRRIAALAMIFGLPALAVSLYLFTGSPQLPDQTLAMRRDSLAQNSDLSTLIAQVEARLETNPDDGLGWATIAPVYVSIGRYSEAVTAYSKAITLQGEVSDLYAGRGEARLAVAEGIVTAEALTDFTHALAIDPKNQRALYYTALSAEQDGHKDRALSIYSELQQTLPPDSEPAALVARRIATLRGTPAPVVPDASTEQGAMIRSMVERLDERLKQDGSDLEGWLKLMRAYQVLGQSDQARDARQRADKAFTSDEQARARIDAAARDLGL